MDLSLKEKVKEAVSFAEGSPEPELKTLYEDVLAQMQGDDQMANITFREALCLAHDEEMSRDENVIVLGEEVAEYNGAYKVTKGLLNKIYSEMGPMNLTKWGRFIFQGWGVGQNRTRAPPGENTVQYAI